MFLLSWIIILIGLIGCPVVMLASNTLYEIFLTSTYSSYPIVKTTLNFIKTIFDLNITGSILSLIFMGICYFFYIICINFAEKVSPSPCGNRYFIFGWLGMFAAFTGIVYAFTCGIESWSFWNGASLKALNVLHLNIDIHPILFFHSCLCLLILSGCLLLHAPSPKVFFGERYRSVFYAIHPDFLVKPQVDFLLTYDKSRNEFYAFPKSSTINTTPSYPLLKIAYISSRKNLFNTDLSFTQKELIEYIKDMLAEHHRREAVREAKAMKGRTLDNTTIGDLITIKDIRYSKNSRDFIVVHGRILHYLEIFKCSDVLQIHIDKTTSKLTISKNTYLCKRIQKALEDTDVSLKGLSELRTYIHKRQKN